MSHIPKEKKKQRNSKVNIVGKDPVYDIKINKKMSTFFSL